MFYAAGLLSLGVVASVCFEVGPGYWMAGGLRLNVSRFSVSDENTRPVAVPRCVACMVVLVRSSP